MFVGGLKMSLRDLIVINWTFLLFEKTFEIIDDYTDFPNETISKIIRGFIKSAIVVLVLYWIYIYVKWVMADWKKSIILPIGYVILILSIEFFHWVGDYFTT